MRHKFFAVFVPPLLLCAAAQAVVSATAADLPRRSSAPRVEYDPPAPAYSWQGLYLGVNAGYGFGAFTDGNFNFLGNPRRLFGGPSGGMVGFTGGYNFVPMSNVVVGLEADFDFTFMKASHMPFFGLASRSSINHAMTLRGRAGYALDRALLYVTGGFAGAQTTIGVTNAFTGFNGQQGKFQTGWAVGAGLEFMLTNNLSAKGEYIFTSVGTDRYFDFSPAALQTGVNMSTVKGGLNYHF
jgi:outer membrane immunogenic protein